MFKQVIEIYDLLDRATVRGIDVVTFFKNQGLTSIEMNKIVGDTGSTDFIQIRIPGSNGKTRQGSAPTLGIIGRLGGIGARPERIGLVSDADGAVTALACALKLVVMQQHHDVLKGDVILSTHICPNAPTQPHEPVPFMGSPVDIATMNKYEVDPEMDAILSIDTTKGNRIANFKGFAITSTVKQGYILRVSEDLLDLMEDHHLLLTCIQSMHYRICSYKVHHIQGNQVLHKFHFLNKKNKNQYISRNIHRTHHHQ